MCSPDTRDVPYVPMWLISFIRAPYSALRNQNDIKQIRYMFQNINVLHFPIVSYVPMWLICFMRALYSARGTKNDMKQA